MPDEALCFVLITILQPPPTPEDATVLDPEDEDLADMSKNNMLQLLYYFEQVGVGLPRLEMFAITLSMKVLIKKEPLATLR